MNKKIILPICEQVYWGFNMFIIIILNLLPYIVRFVINTMLEVEPLTNDVFIEFQSGVFGISIVLTIILGIKSCWGHHNRKIRNSFMRNANKVEGRIIDVEEVNFIKKGPQVDRKKYGISLNGNVWYRAKVEYYNDYKKSNEIIYSEYFGDRLKKYVKKTDCVEVFFKEDSAIVGDFYI